MKKKNRDTVIRRLEGFGGGRGGTLLCLSVVIIRVSRKELSPHSLWHLERYPLCTVLRMEKVISQIIYCVLCFLWAQGARRNRVGSKYCRMGEIEMNFVNICLTNIVQNTSSQLSSELLPFNYLHMLFYIEHVQIINSQIYWEIQCLVSSQLVTPSYWKKVWNSG